MNSIESGRLALQKLEASDCEWAYRLFLIHQKNLDIEYMIQKSTSDLTNVQFQAWLAMNSDVN